MSVGGNIISKVDEGELVCYTVKDQNDVTCVMAKISLDEPGVGEAIWWQQNVIYWDNDRKKLEKVGNSFSPKDR